MQETQPVGFASQTKSKNKLKPIPETTSAKFMLLRNIARQITDLEETQANVKRWIQTYWDKSDVNNPEGSKESFHDLNFYKEVQRDIQKQLRSLRYIQKVIKLFPDDELSLSNAKDYATTLKVWQNIAVESKPKKQDSRKVA